MLLVFVCWFCDCILYIVLVCRQQRGAAKWHPDAEFMKQFSAPVMYPDEVTSLWKMPPYNSKSFFLVLHKFRIKRSIITFRQNCSDREAGEEPDAQLWTSASRCSRCVAFGIGTGRRGKNYINDYIPL